MTQTLPEEFSDLQGFVENWVRPTFMARYAARAASDMEALQRFYDALLPRMPSIMALLDQHADAEPLPGPVETLMQLAMAFMVVSPAVELFHQPEVPYAKDWREAQLQSHC